MNGVLEPLRTHLRVCSAQYATSHKVHMAEREYVTAQRKQAHVLVATATSGGTIAMERDAIHKGESKGKGKNKSKDRSKDQCHLCGRVGPIVGIEAKEKAGHLDLT